MKTLFLPVVILWFIVNQAYGQNKVPNPSFEDFANCPQTVGATEDPPGPSSTVQDWYKAGMGSTDFYNACATGPTDIPANVRGWQQAHTGNGYAGFYAVLEAQLASREYAQCELLTPLQTGHRYVVSFWVSLADTTVNGLKASDEVAAYFSSSYIVVGTSQIIGITPQIKQPTGNFLNSTTNWMQVKDTFTAAANETHMIIGVFSPFASQTYQVISGPPAFYQIYYYLDDVCVLDLDETSLIEVFDTAVCDDATSVTLTARAGMQSYEWSNGSTTLQTTISTSGTYWVRSFGTCEMRIDTFHVGLFADSGKVDLGSDTTICFEEELILNAYRPGFTTYLWNTGANTPQIPATHSGTYSVRVESACGVFTDTVVVTIKDEVPALPSLDTVICTTDGFLIIPVNGENITWYDDLGQTTYPEQPPIDLGKAGVYEYWITQTVDGCESKRSHVKVEVISPPVSMLSDTAICEGKSVWLGSNSGSYIYEWSTGADSCCIQVRESGHYYVKLSNFCGTIIDSAYIAILDNCDNCIWLPTAFSPNADGLNDYFEVKARCPLQMYVMRIYNRYGQLVFTGANVTDTWNGNFHNQHCDGGVYYYYLEATPDVGDKIKISRKGEITLIR